MSPKSGARVSSSSFASPASACFSSSPPVADRDPFVARPGYFHLAARLLVFLTAISLSAAAAARITCCEIDGRRTCGSPPPSECLGKAKRVIDPSGEATDVKAPLTGAERAAKKAEEARLAAQKEQQKEQERFDRMLLDRFASVDDIEFARQRAVSEIEQKAATAKILLEAALERKKKLDVELDFHKDKPAPESLQKQHEVLLREIAGYQSSIDGKDADVKAVNKRFEENKRRFSEINSGRVISPAAAPKADGMDEIVEGSGSSAGKSEKADKAG